MVTINLSIWKGKKLSCLGKMSHRKRRKDDVTSVAYHRYSGSQHLPKICFKQTRLVRDLKTNTISLSTKFKCGRHNALLYIVKLEISELWCFMTPSRSLRKEWTTTSNIQRTCLIPQRAQMNEEYQYEINYRNKPWISAPPSSVDLKSTMHCKNPGSRTESWSDLKSRWSHITVHLRFTVNRHNLTNPENHHTYFPKKIRFLTKDLKWLLGEVIDHADSTNFNTGLGYLPTRKNTGSYRYGHNLSYKNASRLNSVPCCCHSL